MRLSDLISDGNFGSRLATQSGVKQNLAELEEYIERGDQRFDRNTRIFHARIAIDVMVKNGKISESDSRSQALSAFYRKYFGREPGWYVGEGVTIQRS